MKLLLFSLVILIPVYLLRLDAVKPHYQDGDRVRVTVSLLEHPQVINAQQKFEAASLKVYLDRFPEYTYGDRLILEGRVEKGEKGIYLKEAKVVKSEKTSLSFLGIFSNKFSDSFGYFLPNSHAALSKGIILGTKNSLDSDFYNKLKKTGTLHTVVASGTNVSLFAGVAISIATIFLSRKRAIVLGVLVVWFYVLLVGGQPPVFRAALMSTIAFLAQSLGREGDGVRALVITGALMLILNPLWLEDIGFQLSFLATLGIIVCTSRFTRIFDKITHEIGSRTNLLRVPDVFKRDFVTSLSAQIFVSPILFFNLGEISLISPLVNAVVLWTVPFIMGLGIVVGILGMMWAPAGQAAAYFLYLPLEYFIKVVGLFGMLG